MVFRDQALAPSALPLHAEGWSNRRICFTQKGWSESGKQSKETSTEKTFPRAYSTSALDPKRRKISQISPCSLVIIPGVIQTELPITTVMWTVPLSFSTQVFTISDCIFCKYSSHIYLAILMRGNKGVPVMLQFEIMEIQGKLALYTCSKTQRKEKEPAFAHWGISWCFLLREQPSEQGVVVSTKLQQYEITLVLFNIWGFLTAFLSFIMTKKRGKTKD